MLVVLVHALCLYTFVLIHGPMFWWWIRDLLLGRCVLVLYSLIQDVLDSLTCSSTCPPPPSVPTLPASTHSRHTSAHSSALCPSAIADSCTADERLKRQLLEVACKCASDQNSRIAHKWLQFTHELASQYGEDVVVALSELIPVCLKSLGSASSSVRKASVQVRCQHTAREQSNGRHAQPIIGVLNLFAGSARMRAKNRRVREDAH